MTNEKKTNVEVRLKLHDLLIYTSENSTNVKIVLSQYDNLYEGISESNNSSNVNWLVAKAVFKAITEYLGNRELSFSVDGIKLITIEQQNVMMVLVNFQNGLAVEALVGTCIIRKSEPDAVARATLDALNRKIALLSNGN